ncbi:DUF3592 domain-containing protein [Salinispira pacifica]
MRNPRFNGRGFRGTSFFSVFFRGIGLAMLAGGLIYAVVILAFIGRAAHTEGTIVRIDSVKNAVPFMDQVKGSGVIYYPVVQFKTQDGKTIDFRAASGSQRPRFSVGDSVSVMYDPANPSDSRINSLWGVWGAPLILLGIGALFLLLGFVAPMGFGNMPKRLSREK